MKNQLQFDIEASAIEAFSRQAPVFDNLYGNDTIIQYKRKRVRDHIESFLPTKSSILELNAGTGEDAIYFAGKGHKVHATDASKSMQSQMLKKIKGRSLGMNISYELCSFTQLQNLGKQGPYDLIFSNFAGLNCTDQLKQVLEAFPYLVKPGGFVTLVLLPKFCFWESLMLFKGKFKTAFRRFSGKKGTVARLEGVEFRCWYYNPGFIIRTLKSNFTLNSLEGLCTIVPPSYLENFAEKYPRLFNKLVRFENRFKSMWPFNKTGDYYIITLRRHA